MDDPMRFLLKTRNDVRLFTAVTVTGVVLGTLALHAVMTPRDLLMQTLPVSAAVAGMLAAPLVYLLGIRMAETQRLAQRLSQAVSFDSLTGAQTRDSFHARAAAMARGPMTLIVADIDHFKSVNDRFGHPGGDAALQQVAQRLMNHCRAGDLVARFGGEEFVILLPRTGLSSGLRVAERLRATIRDTPLRIGARAVRVTASFGVASLTDPRRIEMAIRAADAALYRAKEQGRDRVCRGGPDPVPRDPAPLDAPKAHAPDCHTRLAKPSHPR